MGGMIRAMGGTLSSCIRPRPRRRASALSALLLTLNQEPAAAQELLDLERLFASLHGIDRQEFAAIALALAILGFSVVSAILLMRTRTRAAENDLRLRSEIRALQAENDRSNALLLSEPQVVVSWRAGDDRPQVAGDTALLADGAPQRVLAFGTWLAPEPSLRLERAIEALRNHAESFALNLATSSGRAIEAVGRVVGGQAIVRFRELSGLRRDLAEITLRYNTLMEETEVLRGFASAIPAPVWARRANGTLSFANPAYAIATEAVSSADAISRNLDLLDSPDRNEMVRALSEQSTFTKRLPVVVRGERRIFDVQAIALRSGSAGIAIDASEAASLRASLSRMADAHRRTLDQLSSAVAVFDAKQRLAFYNESYRRLWNLDVAFLETSPSLSLIHI